MATGTKSRISESELYWPVKALLETLGYEVKAEVNNCDVVAVRDDAPTVVVELKVSFSLELVLQGIDRLKISDSVYLAVPAPDTANKRRNWRSRRRSLIKLCRMLGLGLILVAPGLTKTGQAEIVLDPAPYAPRKNKRQLARLKHEFETRAGDPNTGGVTRTKIVTAYRQDALRCARILDEQGEMKASDVKAQTGVDRAANILLKNHYFWFERVARGIYRLTDRGREDLKSYADILDALE